MNEVIRKKLESHFFTQEPILFKKGNAILEAEDPIENIFLIQKGLVRQYIISEEGEELTINIFRPGSFFPIMLILSNTPNKYNFEAIDDVKVYKSNPEKVLEFLKKEPEVLFDLTTRFAQAISGLTERIEQIHFKQAYSKVASILLYLSKKNLINLALTHKDLSFMTGLTRETVSRQIEKLVKENIVSQKNHFLTIKDLSKLEEIANRTL